MHDKAIEADDPGFGVYVHWPFCLAKCPYCDFNSHVRHGGVDQAAFTQALARELAYMAARTGPRTVVSVFLGGGTPSLMQPESVARVLEAIARCWHLAGDAEVTLEANPTSVEAAHFAGYRAAGVNRVSIGIQALDDASLKALGRLHTGDEAMAALAIAKGCFDRVSFDLIYARPRQTVAAWRRELGRALALGTDHLSLYQLTIEPGTAFAGLHAKGALSVPGDDEAAEFYEATQELCEAHGLPAYEVSNHARGGAESRHNLLYWRYGEYAGVGPGAHARIVEDGARRAVSTLRDPDAWLRAVAQTGCGIEDDTALTLAEQADEMLVMGLRLTCGLDLDRFTALGLPGPAAAAIDSMVDLGLLAPLDERRCLVPTPAGRLVLNSLAAALSQ
jgi:oxygen-independent coproporphyrinogen-3 oxidase